MITRKLEGILKDRLFQGKAILLLGSRQTGKTTLLKKLIEQIPESKWLNGDELDVQALFERPSTVSLQAHLKGVKVLVIDEAQRIHDIGIKLKLITDNIKEVQLIATGSSAFELANEINEPLTGRKWEYQLFPLSFGEMAHHHGIFQETQMLSHRLIYGYYPEVVNSASNEKEILKALTDSYLYKDILMWERIKKPEKLIKLLQALSFQVGNQVSYHELGKLIELDTQTVEKYIQLLEQTFIIFRLGSLSRNLRNELKASRKIYFYDNGIRNALIANFNPINLRNDIGFLWENFLVSERIKHAHYSGHWYNKYFWRTHAQQEIDYIEDYNGQLHAYEFKWKKPHAKNIFSSAFTRAYPDCITKLITQENFTEFITGPIL